MFLYLSDGKASYGKGCFKFANKTVIINIGKNSQNSLSNKTKIKPKQQRKKKYKESKKIKTQNTGMINIDKFCILCKRYN